MKSLFEQKSTTATHVAVIVFKGEGQGGLAHLVLEL